MEERIEHAGGNREGARLVGVDRLVRRRLVEGEVGQTGFGGVARVPRVLDSAKVGKCGVQGRGVKGVGVPRECSLKYRSREFRRTQKTQDERSSGPRKEESPARCARKPA